MDDRARPKYLRYFPLFVELTGRRATVVGGGASAAQKAARLCEYGASVRLIAPRLSPECIKLVRQNRASWLKSGFSPVLLSGTDLVVAAGDRETNSAVAAAARRMRILCSVDGSREEGSFLFPRVTHKGPFTVGLISAIINK